MSKDREAKWNEETQSGTYSDRVHHGEMKIKSNHMSKVNFNFKRLYMNGDLRLLGSRNLYGVWNHLMFKLYVKYTKKQST